MGAHGWYRNRSWDLNIQAAFDARIARSRQPWSKWQYFNIQAGILEHTGFEDVALTLHRRALVEVKAIEPSWRRVTLASIGRLLAKEGKIEEAVRAFEEAIAACSLADAFIRVTTEDEPEAQLRKIKKAGGPSRGR